MRKVLVLGGNGFIGKNLISVLAEDADNEVYSFDINEPKIKNEGVSYIVGDFFDEYVLKNVIDGMDIIYHAICTLIPGNSNDKYVMGYERDLLQTMRMCNLLRGKSVKLIFLSSGGTVYGKQCQFPITEEAKPSPINHYGNLKLCIENTLKVFRYQDNANYVIARIANPYGPGQDYRRGVGFIDAVLKHAIHGGTVEVWGQGNVIRDYIYIEDACKTLAFLGTHDIPFSEVNISSGYGVSQNEIIEIVKKFCPQIKVEYLPARSVDADRVYLSNERLRSVYAEKFTPLEEGINKYYRYITNQKDLLE